MKKILIFIIIIGMLILKWRAEIKKKSISLFITISSLVVKFINDKFILAFLFFLKWQLIWSTIIIAVFSFFCSLLFCFEVDFFFNKDQFQAFQAKQEMDSIFRGNVEFERKAFTRAFCVWNKNFSFFDESIDCLIFVRTTSLPAAYTPDDIIISTFILFKPRDLSPKLHQLISLSLDELQGSAMEKSTPDKVRANYLAGRSNYPFFRVHFNNKDYFFTKNNPDFKFFIEDSRKVL